MSQAKKDLAWSLRQVAALEEPLDAAVTLEEELVLRRELAEVNLAERGELASCLDAMARALEAIGDRERALGLRREATAIRREMAK